MGFGSILRNLFHEFEGCIYYSLDYNPLRPFYLDFLTDIWLIINLSLPRCLGGKLSFLGYLSGGLQQR